MKSNEGFGASGMIDSSQAWKSWANLSKLTLGDMVMLWHFIWIVNCFLGAYSPGAQQDIKSAVETTINRG